MTLDILTHAIHSVFTQTGSGVSELATNAAAAAQGMPVWAQIGGGIATAGFTAWYSWYTTTRTIPMLLEKNERQIEKISAIHSATMKEISDNHSKQFTDTLAEFRREAKEQRELHERRETSSQETIRKTQESMSNFSTAIQQLKDVVRDTHALARRSEG